MSVRGQTLEPIAHRSLQEASEVQFLNLPDKALIGHWEMWCSNILGVLTVKTDEAKPDREVPRQSTGCGLIYVK